MALCRTGEKSLPEPMMTQFTDGMICVSRQRYLNYACIHALISRLWMEILWYLSHSLPKGRHVWKRCRIWGNYHDDSWNGHFFLRDWPFVRGIHRSPVNSPHALMFSLICIWINDWVNNHEAVELRRHRGHYDVTVITGWSASNPCTCCWGYQSGRGLWTDSAEPSGQSWPFLSDRPRGVYDPLDAPLYCLFH